MSASTQSTADNKASGCRKCCGACEGFMRVHETVLVTLLCTAMTLPFGQRSHAAPPAATRGCVDYSTDPAGCQPSTFATPTGQMPSRRVGRDGKMDVKSSETDRRSG